MSEDLIKACLSITISGHFMLVQQSLISDKANAENAKR